MSSRPYAPDLPLSLGQRPGLSHDSRSGLGYGLSKDKLHKPRIKGSSFPYTDPDEAEEVDLEISDEDLEKIANKMATPFKSHDSLIGRTADPFAMANGNARVGVAEATAKGLVPFPNMYKKRMQAGGGVNSPKLVAPGQYNRTGTLQGWSRAPIDTHSPLEYDEDTSPEDVALKKVRKLVRSILKNNTEEE
tara:strand:- start:708 stop:1280 length:573 start_codon:yes stop_codon:yes gene_type:complete